MLLSQFIEGTQEFIENGDGDIRGLCGGPLREADHISEKYGDVIEPIGDRVLLAFESLRDLGRKYVEEEPGRRRSPPAAAPAPRPPPPTPRSQRRPPTGTARGTCGAIFFTLPPATE